LPSPSADGRAGLEGDSDEIDAPSVVIAGLDPAIHLFAKTLYGIDGPPGQARG
jgi:hypothetical protein